MRCTYYGFFLLPDTHWDNSPTKGFTELEHSGLKKDINTLAADEHGFLDCVPSYLRFDNMGDKFKAESTNRIIFKKCDNMLIYM